MNKALRYGVAVLLVGAGLVLAVLMRDTSCTASLPARCSRAFGLPSAIVAALGLVAAGAWTTLTRRT